MPYEVPIREAASALSDDVSPPSETAPAETIEDEEADVGDDSRPDALVIDAADDDVDLLGFVEGEEAIVDTS